jgi:shikimate dehydrogenase
MPKLAVLGQPILHSRSPAIHTAALEELGLAPAWSYEAIELAPDEFTERVRAMPGEGFAGANVTIPHKLAALRVADTASDAAGEIGAANTLTFSGGAIAADNTDATGFLEALPEPPAGTRALVLGAGGAARAVTWALVREGAEVFVWNRTPKRAEALAQELGANPLPGEGQLPIARHELLVNATSVGLSGTKQPSGDDLKALAIDADALNETHTVVDLVYGSAETPLAAAARQRGARVVDGLDVLVHQGAASLRIWTGLNPPIETMREAARR